MSKINLLYIITKLELGGAQKQLLSLISALDKDRYNIFLFTAGDGLLIPEALAIEGLILKRSKFLERVINPLKDILALLEIYFFIKKNRIQIVHTHSSKAGILGRLAAKFAKTPVIIHTVHGWSFNDYQFRPVNYLYRSLERFCATFTSKIIVVSSFDQAKGLRNSIASKERYILIRYGLDDKAFSATSKRREIRQSLGLSDMALVVGMVACFKFQKAPLDFIELAGRIKIKFPDVKFVLVGDGRLRGKIVTRIKQLNLENQIILTGWYKDIPGILSGWDIFVLTSLWEGLPISVLEAMSAGLPAVVTDTGGIREALINGQTGYLVDPHDIVFMQNRVEELLNSAQKRDEFGRSSQEIISRGEFSLSSMFKNTAELYSNLSGESKNA